MTGAAMLQRGPLPKSDSVQSLVRLVALPPPPPPPRDALVVRGLDAQARPHCVRVAPGTDYISLSGLALKTVGLAPLESGVAAASLREISLAANALEVLDLQPLAACTALVVLTLNSNRLCSINLKPLASCPKLERLWLHDNMLESVNLAPLAECPALRSLYLEDNQLHVATVDLSALACATHLRSLRLGGNRLSGKLDITPLLQCPALSVFNYDSSVTVVAQGESSQARISSALRRIVLDIKFTRSPSSPTRTQRPCRGRTTPPVSPTLSQSQCPRPRLSRPGSKPASPAGKIQVVKALLVGFRRLGRYAAEDALSRCGKVMIRAASDDVATVDPGLLLDSHVVLVNAPSEKTLRQVSVVLGRIPLVVVGTERFRSMARPSLRKMLEPLHFCTDPLDNEGASAVFRIALECAVSMSDTPSAVVTDVSLGTSALDGADGSPISDDDDGMVGPYPIRRSFSEASIMGCDVPLEALDDEEDTDDDGDECSGGHSHDSWDILRRSTSASGLPLGRDRLHHRHQKPPPLSSWSEVTKRLRVRRARHGSWNGLRIQRLSLHGKNKLRAERAAIEVAFSDLGDYATSESCAGIARSCALPKCAGPILFRAAMISTTVHESATPEAGVPNTALDIPSSSDRNQKRISADAFLGYYDRRLRDCDGEERLCIILQDGHMYSAAASSREDGTSRYGAPSHRSSSRSDRAMTRRRSSIGCELSSMNQETDTNVALARRAHSYTLQRNPSSMLIPPELSCPCDAGVEDLVTAFMQDRSSRFGTFALVKMAEAVAIGSTLVLYALRSESGNPVGCRARPVCPKEVRMGHLNASLISAEYGMFEGVASGLSMDVIRSIKGSFATEASPAAVSQSGGLALSYTLSLEQVKKHCMQRKTLLPTTVEMVLATHCRSRTQMTLSEFAVLQAVLSDVESHGAGDYLFSVLDVDQDEYWTLPDLRHFHMQKEQMMLEEGMAVSDLHDIWFSICDMIRLKRPSFGVSRSEFCDLPGKDRRIVLESLLYFDSDHSMMNVRKTIELNKSSTMPVVVAI